MKWNKVGEYLASKNYPVVKQVYNPSGAKYVIWHVAFGSGHYVNHRDADKTIIDPYDGKIKADSTYPRISGTIYYK